MNVLLVTGSRSLEKLNEATKDRVHEAWRRRFHELGKHANLIVAGDADGPDYWALCYAERSDWAQYECWSLDGYVETSRDGGRARKWQKDGDPPRGSREHPLVRNGRMVRHVEGLRGAVETLAPDNWTGPGYETRLLCVGFVDPDSRTHGTDHTLRLARQAGIWTARYVWRGDGFREES